MTPENMPPPSSHASSHLGGATKATVKCTVGVWPAPQSGKSGKEAVRNASLHCDRPALASHSFPTLPALRSARPPGPGQACVAEAPDGPPGPQHTRVGRGQPSELFLWSRQAVTRFLPFAFSRMSHGWTHTQLSA